MSGKLPDFESFDFDNADITKEDARVDSFEARLDAERQQQQVAALQQQAVHEAVAQCLGACLAYLDTLYLQRDAEPCTEVALAHNSWQQEAEPEPCSRDAWLRGALPETVVPARTPVPPTGTQAAARSSAGKEQRARPGSGLLSHNRKGPGSVASSAAADDAQHRPQSRAQQSRRTSIAQSVQSTRPDSSRPASTSRPGSGSSTALRPASGTAGNSSTPPAAAAADASDSSSAACTQAAGDGKSNTAAAISPAAAEAANTAAAAAPVSTQRKQAIKASKLTPDQQEAEERLRQELQLRRQQEAVVKDLKQKDEAARAALLNMQKDLKGKDYTYDGRGKVVPLAKVNPEALPAPPGPQFKVQLNTSAAGAAADSTAGTGAAAASVAAAGKQAATSAKSSAVAANSSSSRQSAGVAATNSGTAAAAKTSGAKDAAGAVSPFYVEQASRTQPPVLQSIKPFAGVTLKVGGAAKQGPKWETSAQQQTRTQFQQQAKALNMQTAKAAAGASLGALGSGSRHSNSRVSSAAGIHFSSSGGASSSTGVCSVPGSARSGRGDSAGARASSAGRSTTEAAAAAAAAGIGGGAAEAQSGQAGSMFAGSTAAGSVSQNTSCTAAAGGAGGGVIKAGRGSAGDCSSGPDINLLLVNAPDWGVASGGGPCAVGQVVDVARPSDRQLQEEFGRTTHLPKTRAPVATLKTPKTQPNSTSRLSQLA